MSAWYTITKYTDDATRAKMAQIINPQEILSTGSAESCDHHDVELITQDVEFKYWYVASSGCSCGSQGTVRGPFETVEQALQYVPEASRAEMRRYGCK